MAQLLACQRQPQLQRLLASAASQCWASTINRNAGSSQPAPMLPQPQQPQGATQPFWTPPSSPFPSPLLKSSSGSHAAARRMGWHGALPAPAGAQPASGQPGHATHTPLRGFFSLPNPQQVKEEFFSPDRQGTSSMMTASVLTTCAAWLDRRLLTALIQNNGLLAQGEWWRVVTAGFVHSGLLHLAGNMLAVHYLGPPVEHVTGRALFTMVYLSGVAAGGVAHYLYASAWSSVLGSSGAIAGLFAAWVTWKLRNRGVLGWDESDTRYVVQMVAINTLLALALSGTMAHAAHVGGLVGGAAAMFVFGPRYVWVGGRCLNQPLLPVFKGSMPS